MGEGLRPLSLIYGTQTMNSNSRGDPFHRFSLFIYTVSVIGAPLYFGGERLLAWGVIGTCQFLVLLIRQIVKQPDFIKGNDAAIHWAIGLCLIVLIWACIAIFPLNWFGVAPRYLANPIWQFGNAITGGWTESISVVPDETAIAVIKFIIVAVTFLNGRAIFFTSQNRQIFLSALSYAGSLYSLVAIYWLYTSPNSQIWLSVNAYPNSATGPFISRNSFAMFLGISLHATLFQVFRLRPEFLRSMKLHRGELIRRELPAIISKLTLYFIQLSSLILTASRAGISLVIAAQILMVLIIIAKNRRLILTIIPISLFFLVVGNTSYGLYSKQVDIRSQGIVENFETRRDLYLEVWTILQTNPLVGFGLGSFENVFRAYKSHQFDPWGNWLRAHNAYLELALGLGIPAAVILLIAISIPIFMIIRLVISGEASPVRLTAMASIFSIAAHSFLDFGIQSAGVSLPFFSLLGIALHQKVKRRRTEFI